ncbi:serine proteinase stubble-like protein [Leptotrombidium deliense]|uniref:Serine proteinase stubble-like protein n=1 Tax=Leptotrombidium deliense TaxID=299467 RepID=A0A443SCD3_9ACAR|nr:serine proteinase stubble-like protein [Leptotrombidium deliense]
MHPLGKRKAHLYRLGVGSIDLDKVQMYELEETFQHQGYNPATYENDIALVKTLQPIKLSMESNVNSICLPEPKEKILGKATVTGFGLNYLRSTNIEELMSVEVEVYNKSYCSHLYKSRLRRGMFCAGSKKGGRDSCQGDSGGPLIKRNIDGRAKIIGVVSWGIGCGRKEYPGVYTNVRMYLNWINKFVKPQTSAQIVKPSKHKQVQQTSNDTFNEECLKSHNEMRRKHSSQPLKLDNNLIEVANKLVIDNYYEFIMNKDYGQNIARYYGVDPKCEQVVQLWYGDRTNYDYSNAQYSSQSGAFTQLVWRSSTKLGCAKKAGQSGSMVVICLYDPSGNVRGQFASNIYNEMRLKK